MLSCKIIVTKWLSNLTVSTRFKTNLTPSLVHYIIAQKHCPFVVPHQVINYDESSGQTDDQYREKMEDCFHDVAWFDSVFHLVNALVQYLVSLPMFPWQPNVPDESQKDVARFSLLTLEVCGYVRITHSWCMWISWEIWNWKVLSQYRLSTYLPIMVYRCTV